MIGAAVAVSVASRGLAAEILASVMFPLSPSDRITVPDCASGQGPGLLGFRMLEQPAPSRPDLALLARPWACATRRQFCATAPGDLSQDVQCLVSIRRK